MDGPSDTNYGARPPVKRKRPASEDVEEVPSSTPPPPITSTKRLHIREEVPSSSPPDPSTPTRELRDGTPMAGVVTTPEEEPVTLLRREIPDTYAAEHLKIREVIEIDDEEESQSIDEEEYYSEAAHSPSPELGESPRESFTYPDRNGSKTQAAFEEPTPSIEHEVLPPKGGWPDDGDDVSNDDEVSDDEEASEAVDEETEYIEIVDEEGGYEDQDEDDQQNVLYIASSISTNDAEPVQKMGIEASSSSSSSSSYSSSSSCEPQAPATCQPTTQALLANKTQEPDLTVAEPPGGWARVLPSS
ncbi:MAG: hypothetical protein Q9200_001173, partial [Gallowayella weberi]